MLQRGLELRVIAEAADGLDAVQKAVDLEPDLILLDIGLPTLNGIETARQIPQIRPRVKNSLRESGNFCGRSSRSP